MQTTYYRGFRDERKCAQVRKVSGDQEHELDCRWDLANHSPDGPEWGYGGSGPAQLALALLADAFGGSRAGDQFALGFYQEFKGRGISGLAQDLPWAMSQERVLLEAKDLILQDLDYASSRVQGGRDRLVTIEVNARFDEAEKRGEDLGDFDALEAQLTREVGEEFRKVLSEKLAMPPAVCDQLLQTGEGQGQP
jgi:hypothetical protein